MKILFLVDKYYPKPYANSVCAKNIIEQFSSDNDIDILAYKDSGIIGPSKQGDANVFYVKPDLRLRCYYWFDNYPTTRKGKFKRIIGSFLSKFKQIILFKYIPFYSFSFPKRISKKILKLNKENKYDLIISMLHPFDSNYSLYRLKKKNKINTKWIIYCVDILCNPKIDNLLYKITKKENDHTYWNLKFLKYCDGYVYMESRKNEYLNSKYDMYRNKMKSAEMPMFVNYSFENIQNIEYYPEYENWCYFGSIGGVHYNYSKVIEFFMALPNDKKRILHFYSRGKEVSELKKIKGDNYHIIMTHDYVAQEEMVLIQKKADFLVSLKTSNQISAKFFQYIALKGRIVHFSGTIDDPDVKYLEKYPKALIIKMYDSSIDEQIRYFLDREKEEKIDFDVDSLFLTSKPEYSKKVILNLFNMEEI